MISKMSLFIIGAFAVSLLSLADSSHWDHIEEQFDSHPQYKFEYSVHDPQTHDIKSQQESWGGGYFRGYYKLKESDGSVREAHYTADKHSGFKAKVSKSGWPLLGTDIEPSAHSYRTAHGHQHGGHLATSTQNMNSNHYHQHKVLLYHHH